MRTIKEILDRKEEQDNLKYTGMMYLLVITLIVLAFGMANLNFSTNERPLEVPVTTTMPDAGAQ